MAIKKNPDTDGDLSVSDSERQTSSRQIYAEFEIDKASDGGCPLDEFGSDVEETRQQAVNGACHTDIRVSADDCDDSCDSCTEVVHTVSAIEESCICPVFGKFGFIPNVTAVTDERVRVETYLPDRTQLPELVDELKSVSNGIYLRRLKSIDPNDGRERTEPAVIALDQVTEKQRQAAVKAVSSGYYHSPRETSLGDLADDLDISKAALSQRLRAVESKLALSAFEGKESSR